MRNAFPLILIVILAVNAAAQSGRRITNPPPPPPPPPPAESEPAAQPEYTTVGPTEMGALPESLLNHELKSVEKGSFRLADFSGKVVVVNLWATWCGPCRREIPDYEKVRKEYAGRNVEFIALTTEDPSMSDRVRRFARELNFGFRLGWADRETARTLMNGRNVIPQTLVISPDGRIINHWRGYSASQSRDRLRDTIERALSESSASSKR